MLLRTFLGFLGLNRLKVMFQVEDKLTTNRFKATPKNFFYRAAKKEQQINSPALLNLFDQENGYEC